VWDRTTILEYFSMARRHVAMGERNIARQRDAELERDGHDSLDAERLLADFEKLLVCGPPGNTQAIAESAAGKLPSICGLSRDMEHDGDRRTGD
jgi:hypothetical protein